MGSQSGFVSDNGLLQFQVFYMLIQWCDDGLVHELVDNAEILRKLLTNPIILSTGGPCSADKSNSILVLLNRLSHHNSLIIHRDLLH